MTYISKKDRVILLDKSELNSSSRIRDQFRKIPNKEKINDLYISEDFCYQFRFQIDKIYIKKHIKSKKKFDKKARKILKKMKTKNLSRLY